MSDKKGNIENEQHYVKPPSFLQMAKNFTKELATYVKNGAPNVTEEDYQARLDTCKECEFLIEKTMRCGACGCLLEHKAKWKTTTCPKDKWTKQILSSEEQEAIDKNDEKRKQQLAENLDNSPTDSNHPPSIHDQHFNNLNRVGNYIYHDAEGNKKEIIGNKMFTNDVAKSTRFISPEENAKRQEDNNTDSSN